MEGLPVLGRGTDRNAAALNAQGRNAGDAIAAAEATVSFRTRWQAQFASQDGSEGEGDERLSGASAGGEEDEAGNPSAASTAGTRAGANSGKAVLPAIRQLDPKLAIRGVPVSSPGAGAVTLPSPQAPATGGKATGKTIQAAQASSTDKPKLPQKDVATAGSDEIGTFLGSTPPALAAAEPVTLPITAPTLSKAQPGAAGVEPEDAAGQAQFGGAEEAEACPASQAEARPAFQFGGPEASQTVKSVGPGEPHSPIDLLNPTQLSASAGIAAASDAVAPSAPALVSGSAASTLAVSGVPGAAPLVQGKAKSDSTQHARRDTVLPQKAKPAAHVAPSVDSLPAAPAAIAGTDVPAAGAHDVSSRIKAEASASTHSAPEALQAASLGSDGPARLPNPVAVPISASSAAAGASRTALRETFSAIDADSGSVSPTWTHATPQQAEAGFKDPKLGWVGVRADTNGGGVHAVLVPGSAQAAEELGKHMDGIHTYLAEQHTPLDSLGMDAPGGMGSGAPGGRGLMPASHAAMDQVGYQSANSGSGQNGQPQSDSGNGTGADETAASQVGTNQNGANQGSPEQSSQKGWPEPVGLSRFVTDSVPDAASGLGFEADGLAAWRNGEHISLVA